MYGTTENEDLIIDKLRNSGFDCSWNGRTIQTGSNFEMLSGSGPANVYVVEQGKDWKSNGYHFPEYDKKYFSINNLTGVIVEPKDIDSIEESLKIVDALGSTIRSLEQKASIVFMPGPNKKQAFEIEEDMKKGFY